MLVEAAPREIRLFAVFVIYGKVTSGKFDPALLVARPTSAVQNRNSAYKLEHRRATNLQALSCLGTLVTDSPDAVISKTRKLYKKLIVDFCKFGAFIATLIS